MPDADLLLPLIAIAAVAFAAGFIHSAVGFGFGIVALAGVPFFIEIKAAHVAISLASVPMLLMAAWAYRDGLEWRSLRIASLGALVFLPLGLALFQYMPQDLLVRGTGVAILVMVFTGSRKKTAPRGVSQSSCFTAGALGGFLAGAVSIAGPPIAAFALKQDWSAERFKAFVTQCLLIIALYKGVLLVIGNFVNRATFGPGVTIAIFSIAGVQLGVWASRKIPQAKFKRVVAVALILASGQMIWRGAPEQNDAGSASPQNVAPDTNRDDSLS